MKPFKCMPWYPMCCSKVARRAGQSGVRHNVAECTHRASSSKIFQVPPGESPPCFHFGRSILCVLDQNTSAFSAGPLLRIQALCWLQTPCLSTGGLSPSHTGKRLKDVDFQSRAARNDEKRKSAENIYIQNQIGTFLSRYRYLSVPDQIQNPHLHCPPAEEKKEREKKFRSTPQPLTPPTPLKKPPTPSSPQSHCAAASPPAANRPSPRARRPTRPSRPCSASWRRPPRTRAGGSMTRAGRGGRGGG